MGCPNIMKIIILILFISAFCSCQPESCTYSGKLQKVKITHIEECSLPECFSKHKTYFECIEGNKSRFFMYGNWGKPGETIVIRTHHDCYKK